MYVCVCRSVTDSHICREVAEGACSMRDLRERLGVTTQCGRCGKCARAVLQQALAEQGAQREMPFPAPGVATAA